MNKVVVVGGGYGGAAVAKALDADAEVVLVEPKDAFEHAAGSLRALVRPDWAQNMFFRYDGLLERGTVVRDRVVSADPGGVRLAGGRRIEADYLILATGSAYPFPAKAGTDDTAEALARLRAAHGELAAAGRVLVAGAGPVGLELAGEIKSVWPGKDVVLVDPAPELLPGFAPRLRADLLRQLGELGVEVRLGTALAEEPPGEPGHTEPFTVRTTTGDEISADLWFRAHGGRTNGDYLADGRLTRRTAAGRVHVTERLTVEGYDHVYALGDLTDLPEAKMAGYAMRHAEVVAANVRAQVRGERPGAVYRPSPVPSVLLPLGPERGVGQMPSEERPDEPAVLPAEVVARYKGADLFVGRFRELFGTAPAPTAASLDAAAPDAAPEASATAAAPAR
ncbi:NAD(P)/FAD-dependent oxidoreductase [Streptomyces sp. NPDC001595]|uniref:NAD(P)/FAD-dependent oxidoreductase n=1 Tax=Streptomyces sp. NPDC001532 TaxID=3154520 RepID=UPI00331F3B2D